MDWNLIPEIFYDLIARIIPGSVLVLTAAMVYLGPSKVVRLLMCRSAKVDAQLILLFLLLTYFVAAVTRPVWDVASDLIKKRQAKKRERKDNNKEGVSASTPSETGGGQKAKRAPFDERRILFHVRKGLPKEASRLVKIDAERSLCEVLIVGFHVLWPVDLVFCCFGSPFHRGERVLLLAAMTFSIFSFWKWRNFLHEEYKKSLHMLQKILDEQEREEANTEVRKWWQFWK